MKLSKTQIDVITYMRSGYELGKSKSFRNPRVWLQEGACGFGGKCIDVKSNTLDGLFSRGLVERDEKESVAYVFKLTKLGKEIEL